MVGKTISQHEVLEKLGQGGVGEGYYAEDTSLKWEVAIKARSEQFAEEPQRLAHFERETGTDTRPRSWKGSRSGSHYLRLFLAPFEAL